MYIKDPGINGYYTVMYGDMVYGKAYKPFVLRMLLPNTIKATTDILPLNVKNNIVQRAAEIPAFNQLFTKLNWETSLAPEYFVGVIYMYICLLLFLMVLRYFSKSLYKTNEQFHNYYTVLSVFILPPMFNYYSHIYDFPTLFLFTSCLALLFNRKWMLFIIVYTISCFNKETTILLAMVFFVTNYSDTRLTGKQFWTLFTMQTGIFVIIRITLLYLYRDNPGPSFEYHFAHNIGLIKRFSFIQFFAVLLFVIVLFRDWQHKPQFLKKSIYIVIPIFMFGIFFGRFDELRAFYEVVPILLMLMMPAIAYFLGIKIEQVSGTSVGINESSGI